MKRANNRTVRMGFILKLIEKGKVVSIYRRQIKSRILDIIEASSASEYEISVKYAPDTYNGGIYSTKKELLYALRLFTEKPLLDYLEK